MTEYEIISIAISSITAIIAFVGVLYMSFQLKANHDWNRRIAAQEALKEYNQSALSSNLQSEFDYLNRSEPIPLRDVLEKFGQRPELQLELHQMLNL